MSSDDLSVALRAVFTWKNFVDGCAGAAGGTSAITVFYPLNIIRTQLQCDDPSKKARTITDVINDISKADGIPGFYRGWQSQVIALGTSNFIYFYVYNMLKVIIQKKTSKTITPVMNLGVGAAAGIVNVLMTTPLWMIATQLMAQARKGTTGAYTGVMDGLHKCYKNEGIGGLWKGLIPNLWLVSNPIVHFFAYERVRILMAKVAEKRNRPITSLEFFLMGAFAKTLATVLTYPIQLIQSQMRNDRADEHGNFQYNGVLDCAFKVMQKAGPGGLYRGMTAKLWQTVLTAAFQFMAYENIRGAVLALGGTSTKKIQK